MKKDLENIFSLDGKVEVVTGATGLLGRKHVEAIAAYGGTPVILDLLQNRVEELADEINQKYSVNASGFSVDITDELEIEKNCAHLIEKYGKIDGLVNNAANNPKVEESSEKNFSRLENFPLNVWNQDIAVGLTGAFLCAKHYGTSISNNSEGGVILNISSDLGLIAPDQRLYRQPGLPEGQQPVKPVTYSVAKTGLIGLTRYLATYWPDRVRCNVLCPGGVEAGQPNDFLKEVTARIPMGRLAQANEYQGALLFLLSEASAYLNGAILPMDGGRSVW
jgi:NAD(P)-dependent dehydrogenase (short-subunit alcohol dehydrogenase family)